MTRSQFPNAVGPAARFPALRLTASAVVLLAIGVALFAAPPDTAGPEPANALAPDVAPLPADDDATELEPGEFETFEVDVTDLCEVVVRGRLRRTTDGEYVVGVSVRNVSDGDIPGPILLVPQKLGIDGFAAADLDGYLVADEGFFELLPEEGLLAANETTPLRQVTFAFDGGAQQDQRLTPTQIRDFAPTWQVRRDKPEPVGSRQPSPRDLQKFARKAYSYEDLQRVMSVQDRWTPRLMAQQEVFGTATAEDRNGRLVVQVFAPRAGVARDLPTEIAGIPVEVRVMGHIYAGPIGPRPAEDAVAAPLPESLPADPNNSGQTGPTHRVRPCSIGSSTSNISDVCQSGTIGFVGRTAGGAKFLVSNFHVWTDLTTPVGDGVIQPSRGDNGCATNANDVVGTVSAFLPVLFNGSNNVIDCAAATMGTVSGQDAVDASTPQDGYGFPKTTVATPVIGDRVRKYGRTTRLTEGEVFAVNATVNVNYGDGRVARFVRQIGIEDDGEDFSNGGDSGSLIVDEDEHPVALLFAGGGTSTFANPIADVLSQFALTVVGNEGGVDPPVDPETASIGDLAWLDKNGNGVKDANELGIKGITVRLFSAGGNGVFGGGDDFSLGSDVTQKGGRYRFSNLAAGAYYLQFTPKKNQVFTRQDATADALDSDAGAQGRTGVFLLGIGQSDLSRDAGLTKSRRR